MTKQIGSIQMRELAEMISDKIPGLGFALFTFEFYGNGKAQANYISNAKRDDMIKYLEETLERFKNGGLMDTPNNN